MKQQLCLNELSNINISVDRVGFTISSASLISSINSIMPEPTGTNSCGMSPKEISSLIASQISSLDKNLYEVTEKKEYLRSQKKSVRGFHIRVKDKYLVGKWGEITIRVIAWHPFPILVYINFNRLLKSLFEKEGLKYQLPDGHDNAFEETPINRGYFKALALEYLDAWKIDEELIKPLINRILPELAVYFKWSCSYTNQIEFPIDVEVGDDANEILFRWATENMKHLNGSKLRFEDGKYFFNMTHDKLQFKAYTKGKLIRFELTFNTSYMKKEGISRRTLEDQFAKAEELFKRLNSLTKPIKVEKINITRENRQKIHSAIRTEKDIKVLKALIALAWQSFRNIDIRKINNLTRNEVYYRLKYKLSWLLDKTGLKWLLKEGALHLVKQILDALQQLEFLMEKLVEPNQQEAYLDMFGVKPMMAEVT